MSRLPAEALAKGQELTLGETVAEQQPATDAEPAMAGGIEAVAVEVREMRPEGLSRKVASSTNSRLEGDADAELAGEGAQAKFAVA